MESDSEDSTTESGQVLDRSTFSSNEQTRRFSTGDFIMEETGSAVKKDSSFQWKLLRRPSGKRSVRKVGIDYGLVLNHEAVNCSRFAGRRNAICDPFRMLLPQYRREELQANVDRRKTSVSRKVSHFLTVSLDLNRDEKLI
ncbi:hypothetical protein DPMN_071719 [Dreissena polymorpha]|uniref:Uncharacterized protein n=1 Tax=Dreissena polymorpha TaxID=45954 RepID=A0A9D3Z566_DREPO|nr:hypothetical protein DPMN_071719 [Dreissena polymorpha]